MKSITQRKVTRVQVSDDRGTPEPEPFDYSGLPPYEPPTPEEDAQMDKDFIDDAIDAGQRLRDSLPAGHVVGHRAPVWVTWLEQMGYDLFNWGDLAEEPKAPDLFFTFHIDADTAMKVALRGLIRKDIGRDGKVSYAASYPGDLVELELWYKAVPYKGEIKDWRCEMALPQLVFRDSTHHPLPQAIVDKAAEVWDIDYTEWQFGLYASMLPGDRCHQCRRPLRDQASRILNIGPDCAKRMGLPHGDVTAKKVSDMRRGVL